MNSRCIAFRLLSLYKQELPICKNKSQFLSRYLTTNSQTQLNTPTHRFAIKRYVLLLGVPLSSALFYRLSTKYETRRKHRIIVESIGRAARAVLVGIQSVLDQQISTLFKREGSDEYIAALHECRRRNAKRFVNLCIDAGGVYVKIGQAFINLPEVVPLEYYEELQILEEHALRREKGEIDTLFKRYFHGPPEVVFENFNRNPIAAASLAEVYEAQIKSGEKVAVKVQYFDLRERYETDITTAWMLDELHDDLTLELDFLHEARNAERSRGSVRHLDYVYVPKVHWNLTKKRILTYEFVEGITIDRVDELKKHNLSLKDIDEKLIRLFAEQIFRTGFVHADPHPGNVHVRVNKNKKSKGSPQAEIILLDHGLYENLLSEERKILCDLWMATVNNDHIEMRQTATALGAPQKDYELFCTLVTMKPLPDTEKYIIPSYASDWDPLPRELQMIALKSRKFEMPNEDEYITDMTNEQRAELKRDYRELMDKKRIALFHILKQMPKTMFLLLRNLNAVRNTLKIHNVPDVDRTRIMTEVCQQALKEFQTKKRKI
ncbi:unnamed protein product [Rotaria socialis]|uniref:ABC1 atypical kinase-like domain-containing protein n=1 Tax=Rotaria socialis TaxID=392032 RepID=A0A818E217_9BILA|nr:unnamed protein product [Rotaria socialis]CAF4438313.1 unnamed protein product [Rotaria socialis]CAF4693037.1 unnamed protein product [Rotaria socialis]